MRPLYLAAEFVSWVDEESALDDLDWSDRSGGRSRYEHLEQTLADFRCNEHPLVGDLYRIVPHTKGVWKMHSPGLRIFGWVPDAYSFVAVKAAYAEAVHGKDSQTDALVEDVLRFTETHNLSHTIRMGDRREHFQKKA